LFDWTKQRRPSTVGEKINQTNGDGVLALITDFLGRQLWSFFSRTQQMKNWPHFGASNAATSWRKDRDLMKIMKVRIPTFSLVEAANLSLRYQVTRGSPKHLLSRRVKCLGPRDLPAKGDLPCSVQPIR